MTQGTSETPRGSGETLRMSRIMWQMPLLRGLVLLALGVLLLVEPLTTLSALVVLFSVFLVVDAVLAAVQGLVNRDQVGWRWWLVQSAADVVFAGAVALWPSPTPLVLFYLLLVWALVAGIVSIVGGVTLARNRDLGWSWVLTTGIISTLFGLMLLTKVQSVTDVLGLVVVVFGLYAFVLGAVHVVSVFSMRWVAQEIDRALGGQSLVVAGVEGRRAARAATQEPDSGQPAEGMPAAPAEPAASADPQDRVSDDELAGLGFPDTPGMVTMPAPPTVFDDDEEDWAGERTEESGEPGADDASPGADDGRR